MRNIFIIFLLLGIFSCASKGDIDSLTVPPNFTEIPDLKNPEKFSDDKKEENVARLKELLLKSD